MELLAPNVSDFPADRSEAAVRALVEAGADVSRLRLDECLEKCCKVGLTRRAVQHACAQRSVSPPV